MNNCADSTGTSADIDLVHLAQQGSEEAFAQLVRRHQKMGLAVASQLLKNRDDAADAVQDAFIKAHRSLSTFQGKAAFGTWFYTIVRSICYDRLRLQRHTLPLSPTGDRDEDSFPHPLAVPDPDPVPEEVCIHQELSASLHAAIKHLPAPHQEVLNLFYWEDLTTREVASRLGINENTVKSRLLRARQTLRVVLESQVKAPHNAA